MTNPDFKPEVVKKSSAACEGLCLWVYAMEKFDKIYKIVGPLERKFEQVKAEANDKRKLLEEKQQIVRDVSFNHVFPL
jgi:dynein heavy chain